jgi:hypothetical protein
LDGLRTHHSPSHRASSSFAVDAPPGVVTGAEFPANSMLQTGSRLSAVVGGGGSAAGGRQLVVISPLKNRRLSMTSKRYDARRFSGTTPEGGRVRVDE